jgi:hypothetical protein
MQVSIDNLTGIGPLDYTGSIDAAGSVVIKRVLNASSECSFAFLPDAQQLAMPLRFARVVVMDSEGLVLFTGYVAAPPPMLLVGVGISGPCYRAMVTALSDELLLDSTLSVKTGTALNQSVTQALQTLTSLAGGAALTVNSQSSTAVVGRYEAKAATSWSTGAGALAASVRSAYRVSGGVTSVAPVGSVVHTLSETAGTLQLAGLQASVVKLLANDVTVCGKVEPAAYVTEIFQGDGVTTVFQLTELPFEPLATEKLQFIDLFQGAGLNRQVWGWTDPGSRVSVTSAGLTCTGGTGLDGQTVASALHQVELGGSVVIEAGGVQIGAGSQGILLGLYVGAVASGNCFAGFAISQSGGSTQIGAMLEGAATGNVFPPVAGHLYTLRLRVYSPEMERVQPSYYFLGANGIGAFGGAVIVAPGHVIMQVQDVTGGTAGAITTLYEGSIAVAPPVCTIGLIDSQNLVCSMANFSCAQASPLFVTMTPLGGSAATQLVDRVANGGMCKVGATGKLTFYSAYVPAVGALITVSYRTKHRAVARRSNAQSLAQGTVSSAEPATAMWMGTVSAPAAWSSADCDNAAQALLMSSAASSAAWSGSYAGWNLEAAGDIWPGDVLALSSASSGLNASVVVREVQIQMGCARPQMVKYVVRFANDWAEELAIKLSAAVPEDAWLPAVPTVGGVPLNNLMGPVVSAVTGSQIVIAAGVQPPAGGGFEVKRKDWIFGPGVDSDLVMRSPVPNFIIPREASMEQYYIRMYDGSTPPNYSWMSTGVFVNVPL